MTKEYVLKKKRSLSLIKHNRKKMVINIINFVWLIIEKRIKTKKKKV